jgi:GTPase SAR1 family protein
LILVFNKIDLYPDTDRQAIYQNLRQIAAGGTRGHSQIKVVDMLLPDEIVMVAAEPAPLEVRLNGLMVKLLMNGKHHRRRWMS